MHVTIDVDGGDHTRLEYLIREHLEFVVAVLAKAGVRDGDVDAWRKGCFSSPYERSTRCSEGSGKAKPCGWV